MKKLNNNGMTNLGNCRLLQSLGLKDVDVSDNGMRAVTENCNDFESLDLGSNIFVTDQRFLSMEIVMGLFSSIRPACESHESKTHTWGAHLHNHHKRF